MSFWNNLEEGYESRCKLAAVVKTLNQCEKISIVFLLCRKSYNGQTVIEYLLNTSEPKRQNEFFCNWLLQQPMLREKDWGDKFVEPLTIIQNYKAVSVLGYDEVEVYDKFEPKNNLVSFYASRIKKALFNLCEHFTREEVKKFIYAIEDEYQITNTFIIDEAHKHLEYRLLMWSAKGIINLDDDKKINLNAVIKHLRQFNLGKIINDLEKIVSNNESMIIDSHDLSLSSDYYDIIDKNCTGLCVIINQKNFPADPNSKREGTEKDGERLEEVFTAFGFEVKEHKDVNYYELMTLLGEYRKQISRNHSCFVLIILSHGSENSIYTTDFVEVKMDTIEMKFQGDECPNLIGKPKIFIIQSCQGDQWQVAKLKKIYNIETDSPNVGCDIPLEPETSPIEFIGPQKGDSIIAWSTVQGYASFRDKINGSWYIEELCKQLWQNGEDKDLEEILRLVNKYLRSKIYDKQVMVPSLTTSVRAKVKFPFIRKKQCLGRRALIERLAFEKYFKEFLCENFKTVKNDKPEGL